jgi:hypothetical protein
MRNGAQFNRLVTAHDQEIVQVDPTGESIHGTTNELGGIQLLQLRFHGTIPTLSDCSTEAQLSRSRLASARL